MASMPRSLRSPEAATPASSLTLPGRLDAVGDAGDWLTAWLSARAVPGEIVFSMRLCLEEALANIVLHGGEDLTVETALIEAPGRLVLSIADDGRSFDPVTAALPQNQEIGGNGLLLLRRYCSDLSYRRHDGRNELSLGFRVPDESPAPGR